MEPPEHVLPSGTEVQYYAVCQTKLWLFSHHIRMEDNSEDVSIGRVIHEDSFKREHKDILIHEKIALDFIRSGERLTVHEVKKEYTLIEVHRIQLKYYLWYLRHILSIWPVEGVLEYPTHKTSESVILTEEDEKRIPIIIDEIFRINQKPLVPSPKKVRACSKCAYFEFCWV